MMSRTEQHSLWMFILLVLIFAVPLLSAWWLVANHQLGMSLTERGQLIRPPLSINNLQLMNSKQQPINQQQLKGKWLVMYFNPSNICGSQCQTNLYKLQQIYSASGNDKSRLQRALLVFTSPKTPTADLTPLLQQQFNGTVELLTSTSSFKQFVSHLPNMRASMAEGGFYVVDPLGNVIMNYPSNADAQGIFKDVKQLLKVSQIG